MGFGVYLVAAGGLGEKAKGFWINHMPSELFRILTGPVHSFVFQKRKV